MVKKTNGEILTTFWKKIFSETLAMYFWFDEFENDKFVHSDFSEITVTGHILSTNSGISTL